MFSSLPPYDADSEIEGIVQEVIRQGKEWRVKVYGVSWPARSLVQVQLVPGDYVRVIGRKDLTLLIEPC